MALRWLAILVAPIWGAALASDGWVAVGCFVGDGMLQGDVAAHVEAWRHLAADRVVVLEGTAPARNGELPRLMRREWRRGAAVEDGVMTGGGVGEALTRTLAAALRGEAQRRCLLALMGHGSAAAGGFDGETGDVWRLWGARDGTVRGLSAGDIAGALRKGLRDAGRERVDVLVLEACYSASLETLAELEGLADWVVAVPGEIGSPGVHWSGIGPRLAETGYGATHLARSLVASQAQSSAGEGAPVWSLSACNMGRLKGVVEALGAMSRLALRELDAFASAARWTESRRAVGERLVQAADVADLAAGLAAYAQGEGLREAASELQQRARELVTTRVVVGTVPEEVGRWMAQRCGVTLFLPPLTATSVARYVAKTRLAGDTGYGRLLEQYTQQRGAWDPLMP